jgi:hypothetical protein
LQADTDNHFRFYLGAAAVGSTIVVQTGNWYHVAGTYAAKSNLGIYVNGSLEAAVSYGGTRTANGTLLQIGASAVWAGRYFSGRIDEAALYDRALSSSDLAAIYAAGSTGKCKTPTLILQPQSVLVPAGQPAVFSVSACGTPPLTYQWLVNETNLTDAFPISGSQSRTLIITNAQYTNAGAYQVVATNSLGVCTSAPASLTVFAPTPVAWADWTSATVANPGGSAKGTLTSGPTKVEVSYSGEVFYTTQTNGTGVNYYLPLSTYTNSAVTNPPVTEMITFVGGSTTNTLWFSPPVPYPILAIVSLGSPGINVDLAFNAPFSILTTGPGSWGSGPLLTQTANTLHGAESDGLIRFKGTFSSISWTVSPGDTFYNGFTVGAFASLLFPLNIQLQQGSLDADPSVVLSWGNSAFPAEAFALQAATNVAGPYSTLRGVTSPYTNTADSRQMFFRLKTN